MRHAATTAFVTDSGSQETTDRSPTRPSAARQNTADILEYYNSAEASIQYSAADPAQTHSSSHHRPSPAPQRPLENGTASSSNTDEISRQSSIRLVPSNSTSSTSRYPEALPRPSLHHADSNIVVTANRKIAIIERDGTPTPSNGNPSLPSAAGGSPTSILARRGVDRSRLALVSPPEVAPSAQVVQSSPPSAAAFALSKSSRTKYAESRTSPTSAEGQSTSHHQHHTHVHAHRGHGRSSSEVTTTASHSTKTPSNTGKSSSGDIPKTPRDVGIIGTVRTLARRSDLEAKTGTKHRRKESTGHASSGSDYGDEPSPRKAGDVSGNQPLYSPVFQKNSRQETPASQRPLDQNSSSPVSHGMHLPLPTSPRTFGSPSGQTPMLTPAIGDTKPIDFKVAAPVVVDIHSDLADLWLAATPDGGMDFGSIGSPTTAMNTATGSSLSPGSSGQLSSTSPSTTRTQHYDPVLDSKAGPVPLPPQRIDVNSLVPGSSPICPPRPQRDPSPAKGRSLVRSQEEEIISNKLLAGRVHDVQSSRSDDPSSSMPVSDAKYALLAVSDDESSSDYSNDMHNRKTSRSYSAAAPSSSLSKNGSIHIREGAFPANSVFLQRLKTDVDAEQLESEMKTPTNNKKLANMFTSQSVQDIPSTYASARKGSVTSSKGSHGRSSNELHSRKPRPHTAETPRNNGTSTVDGHSSIRPTVPPKEVENQLNGFTWEGSDIPSRDSPSEPSPDSPTDSTTAHRTYSHSHLGHGPPPSGRTHGVKGPSAFKAKGPLATSGTLRTVRSRKVINNPPSMWPAAMSFADVLSEPTPLARSIGYAMKINELSREDCGLGAWIEAVLNKNNPPVMTSAGPVPVGTHHLRFVSGNSAMSEMTFPMRPDAYKAIDLTPGGAEISTNEVPSTLPYPTLALQQQRTGSRPAVPPIPPPKSSISSAVKSGSATFLATFGRRASMRKGTQSATEARDREKEPKAAPRKLVSSRAPPSRSGDTTPPPPTPNRSNTILPTAPTLPGGPRSQRPKRASTMMIGPPKPIISSPIPITQAPLSASSNNGYPESSLSNDDDPAESPTSMTAQPMKLSKDVPRAPDGPRAPRISRTPSFPGSSRVSSGGNIRSIVSFKPSASPLVMQPSGSRSAVGMTSEAAQSRASEEFNRDLDKLCDVLPHVPKDTLAIYLSKADGRSMMAIGRYLEDERQGTVLRA